MFEINSPDDYKQAAKSSLDDLVNALKCPLEKGSLEKVKNALAELNESLESKNVSRSNITREYLQNNLPSVQLAIKFDSVGRLEIDAN